MNTGSEKGGAERPTWFTECDYPTCCCPRRGRCGNAEMDDLIRDQCTRLRMMYQFDAANLLEILVMERNSWKQQFLAASAAASEFSERWEDKREQQTANAVDSAPSDCTTASPKSAPVFKATHHLDTGESDPAVTLDCAGADTSWRWRMTAIKATACVAFFLGSLWTYFYLIQWLR